MPTSRRHAVRGCIEASWTQLFLRVAIPAAVAVVFASFAGAASALLIDPSPPNECETEGLNCPPPPPGQPPPPPAPADVGVVKTASVAAANVGAQITYTLTVTNHGPGAADAVEVTD